MRSSSSELLFSVVHTIYAHHTLLLDIWTRLKILNQFLALLFLYFHLKREENVSALSTKQLRPEFQMWEHGIPRQTPTPLIPRLNRLSNTRTNEHELSCSTQRETKSTQPGQTSALRVKAAQSHAPPHHAISLFPQAVQKKGEVCPAVAVRSAVQLSGNSFKDDDKNNVCSQASPSPTWQYPLGGGGFLPQQQK